MPDLTLKERIVAFMTKSTVLRNRLDLVEPLNRMVQISAEGQFTEEEIRDYLNTEPTLLREVELYPAFIELVEDVDDVYEENDDPEDNDDTELDEDTGENVEVDTDLVDDTDSDDTPAVEDTIEAADDATDTGAFEDKDETPENEPPEDGAPEETITDEQTIGSEDGSFEDVLGAPDTFDSQAPAEDAKDPDNDPEGSTTQG